MLHHSTIPSFHSTWRPAQLAAPDNMAMQVGHRLARGGTVVENEPETGLADPKVLCHLSGFEQQMAKDFVIFRRSLGDTGNRFLGNNQDMGRRLRLSISKSQHQLVFIDNRGRDLSRNDLFE